MFNNLDIDNIVRNVGPLFVFGLILGFFLGWFLGRARLLPTVLLVAFLFVFVGGYLGSRGERLRDAVARIFQAAKSGVKSQTGTSGGFGGGAGNPNATVNGVEGGGNKGTAFGTVGGGLAANQTPTWDASGFNLVVASRQYHKQMHADLDLRGVGVPIAQRDGYLVTLDVQRNGAPDELHLLWRRYFDTGKTYWRPREIPREEAVVRILATRVPAK